MFARLKTAPLFRSPLALFSVIYLSFALTLTFYHAQTIERKFWQARKEFHEGIVGGQFYAPYQYRVGAIWLAEAGGWIAEKTLGLAPGKPDVSRTKLATNINGYKRVVAPRTIQSAPSASNKILMTESG